jgi:small subunit ribosomal protein S6
MMRRYETIFIASPTLTDEQADELVKQYEGIIAEQGGELLKTDKWGRKKLAYEVQKFSEGYYTLFEMNAGPNLIAELERRFRNNDAVIKYLSVRMDEAEKAAGRTKQRIEREAKRKAQAGIKERSAEEVMG